MKTITVDEELNWLQDNTKFIILKSFICACAAFFMNLIRNGWNNCIREAKTKAASLFSDMQIFGFPMRWLYYNLRMFAANEKVFKLFF